MKTHVVFFICLVLLGGVISAQNDSTMQKAQNLCVEADRAFTNGDYQHAIDNYLKALALPGVEDWSANLYYAVSLGYSRLENADEAFAYLDSAVGAGYTDYRGINHDPNFDFLRKKYADKFKQAVDHARAVKADEILRKTPIETVEYDNYNGPLDISDFDWEDINRPELDTLRNEYQLREVMGTEGTEFTRMKRLLDWVSTRWVHNGSKMAPVRTGLAILREVDKGERFCCANYADVLIDCMKSLGYPARFVGLRMDDAAYNMGGGHGCIEVWSNQYQKWILLDGQNNAWWEHDSIPLSAYECHQLFVNGKEDELKFVGQHEGFDYDRAQPTWSAYFYRVINYWMHKSLYLVLDSVTPGLLYQLVPQNHVITDQYDEVYPRLNQTKIGLSIDGKDSFDSLTVTLAHTMPYFDRFLIRIDGGDWEKAADTLQWVLKGGLNSIEAKAVNVAGVEGKPSRIVVRYNPDYSK